MIALALWACAGSGACPPGTGADADRAEHVVARARSTVEGREALGAAPPICFGDGEPGIGPTGVVTLARAMSDDASAARLVHLVAHGPTVLVVGPGEPCDAAVDRAIRDEAAAWATEVRVRAALGVTDPPLVFDAWKDRAASDQQAGIAAWLRAHPDGGSGVPGLASAYVARCENTPAP